MAKDRSEAHNVIRHTMTEYVALTIDREIAMHHPDLPPIEGGLGATIVKRLWRDGFTITLTDQKDLRA